MSYLKLVVCLSFFGTAFTLFGIAVAAGGLLAALSQAASWPLCSGQTTRRSLTLEQ